MLRTSIFVRGKLLSSSGHPLLLRAVNWNGISSANPNHFKCNFSSSEQTATAPETATATATRRHRTHNNHNNNDRYQHRNRHRHQYQNRHGHNNKPRHGAGAGAGAGANSSKSSSSSLSFDSDKLAASLGKTFASAKQQSPTTETLTSSTQDRSSFDDRKFAAGLGKSLTSQNQSQKHKSNPNQHPNSNPNGGGEGMRKDLNTSNGKPSPSPPPAPPSKSHYQNKRLDQKPHAAVANVNANNRTNASNGMHNRKNEAANTSNNKLRNDNSRRPPANSNRREPPRRIIQQGGGGKGMGGANANTNTNTNARNSGNGFASGDGIEKLRHAFIKSLSADRERRMTRAKENAAQQREQTRFNYNRERYSNGNGSESRLEQLLRMSKMKAPHHGRNQNNNHHNNNNFRQQKDMRRGRGVGVDVVDDIDIVDDIERDDEWWNSREGMRERERRRILKGKSAEKKQKHVIKNMQEQEYILPNRTTTVLELSNILCVKKQKLRWVLNQLGEQIPYDADLSEVEVDADMAELAAMELGLDNAKRAKKKKSSTEIAEERMRRQSLEDDASGDEAMALYESYPSRPPVVCIMGHVDHGKTTLMDRLRQRAMEAAGPVKKSKKKSKKKGKKKGKNQNDGGNNVAGTEAGGITQVVSAFQIKLPGTEDMLGGNDAVTFLDTPGHAAFKAMRQSGSNGADVIVLVVAADDGVSPQTVEIIDMYKSIARSQPGSISLVVAMNKIDKPGIDVEESMMRIENQLMEHEIYSERMSTSDNEFGGIQMVPVSGLTGDGLDDLIEGLVLHSEIMDLRACQESSAEGLIIDAKIEKGLGVVADCIIRWGKLEVGDYVLSDVHGGRVRILNDVNNKNIKIAGPSQPVRIVGLSTLPKAGDPIICVQSEEEAKEIISMREAQSSSASTGESYRADSNAQLDVIVTGGASKKQFMADNVLRKFGLDSGENNEETVEDETSDEIRIPVILKADADGTLAALRDTILAVKDESKLNLCIDPVEMGIGHVTLSDVNLATTSGASIFCFNLKGSKDKTAMSLASTNNVQIRNNDVIYHLLDEAKDVFSEYCPAVPEEIVHGKAVVQAVFNINNKSNAETVAGLMVKDGRLHLDMLKTDSGKLKCEYRVMRDGKEVIGENLRAKSIRKSKEEVTDVRRGEECGLSLKDYTDVMEGDIIECYSIEMKKKFV